MKKFSLLDGAALVVWLLPVFYLLVIYGSLPVPVPLHYDINGNVDRYGSKTEFLMYQLIMQGAALFVYLLLKFLPAIDPKKQVKFGESSFQKLALGLVVFIAALSIAIMYATLHQGFKIDRLIFPVIGLLFAFMGNIWYSIKPNYFAGLKIPWALENEDNWRATHRMAGKLWFAGGLMLTVTMLLLPAKPATIVFISVTVILVLAPYIYSYRYFKNQRLNQN